MLPLVLILLIDRVILTCMVNLLPRAIATTRRLTYGSIDAANDERSRVLDAAPTSGHLQAAFYGVLNAMMIIPCMIAVTHVIFRDPFYAPYLPILMKMIFFSCAIHQLVFTCMSRLPFSCGQVQVAGMVFMATMASNIAHHNTSRPAESTLATTLICLMISTILLGICLMVAGQLRLATLVHYLPMPLVGGFSAFVGLFCMETATAIITNQPVQGVRGLVNVDGEQMTLVLPPIIIGVVLIVIRRQFSHHTWILPLAMAVIPAVIAAAILISGNKIQEDTTNSSSSDAPATATISGSIWSWSKAVSARSSIWDAISLFKWNQVWWWSIVRQIPTWSAMFFLVSFTSSLDVSALEMDTARSLDFNHELAVVGWSNLISGLLGGVVGSMDRAQSMRAHRAHGTSRAAGIVVAICELIIVIVPHSLLTVVPKLFIAGILCFLALSLWREWLVHARRKMLPLEYGVVWLTFIATASLGIELGLFFGLIGAAFHFLYTYSTRMVAEERHVGSAVIRNFEKRAILSSVFQEIVTLRLGGFIFFGSALQLLDQVKKAVLVPLHNDELWHHRLSSPHLPSNGTSQRSSPSLGTVKSLLSLENDEESPSSSWEGSRTRYVILDCLRVPGIDASGVRSCFLSLKHTLAQHGIVLVFCSLTPEIETLLRSHGVLERGADQCIMHHDVDAALEWCEDRLIQYVQATQQTPRRKIDHHSPLVSLLGSYLDLESLEILEGIEVYFEAHTYRSGDVLFRRGEPADQVYFVHSGQVSLFLPMRNSRRPEAADPLSKVSGTRAGMDGDSPELAALIEDAKGIEDFRVSCHEQRRLLKITQGGCFGELNYFLQQPRLYSAHVVSAEPALLYCLSRSSLTRMSVERPEQATMVQTVLLKSMSLSVANTLDLDRDH